MTDMKDERIIEVVNPKVIKILANELHETWKKDLIKKIDEEIKSTSPENNDYLHGLGFAKNLIKKGDDKNGN